VDIIHTQHLLVCHTEKKPKLGHKRLWGSNSALQNAKRRVTCLATMLGDVNTSVWLKLKLSESTWMGEGPASREPNNCQFQ
jgi:hypothetical protein